MKKILLMMLTGILAFTMLTGCQQNGNVPKTEYNKYSVVFTDEQIFNTVITVVGYTKSEEEFDKYSEMIHDRMLELHKYYDKYNDYEGINNIKTINDNAGVKPVKVSKDIIDLILFCKKMYEEVGTKTNIAMGSVLKIWHDYREEAEFDPKVPTMEELLAASEHTDLDKVIVDVENSTVYLNDPLMSLDVGAVAKGYATEVVVQEVIKEGFTSGIISSGGNIRAFGMPMDGIRAKWGIGLREPPDIEELKRLGKRFDETTLDVVFVNDASVVSSGDYERFYFVDDKIIHHLIDPDTLMPGDHFRAVTVITEDSGVADFLSTTVFLLPYEEGRALVESMDGVEAMWVFKDKTIEATDGMKAIMQSHGATGAIEK
jgi:thiamine biosynthesis lipoprotein